LSGTNWLRILPGMRHSRHDRFAAALLMALPCLCRAQGGALTLNEALDNLSLVFTTGGEGTWNPITWTSPGSDVAWAHVVSGDSAWVETELSGPGWISSWNAGITVSIDGTAVPTSVGQFLRELPAGSHLVRWTVTAAVNSAADGWLDGIGWFPFAATPLVNVTPSPGVTWTTSPEHPWFGTSWPDTDGAGALRPPSMLSTPADSWIEASFAGPAEVEFMTLAPGWPPGEWKKSVLYVPGNSMRWDAGSVWALDGVVARPEIPLGEALDAPGVVWSRQYANFYGTPAGSFDGSDAARLEQSPDGQARVGLLTATFDGPAWFSIKARTIGSLPLISTETGATGKWAPTGNEWQTFRVPVAPGVGRTVTIRGLSVPDLFLDEASLEPIPGGTIADGLEAPDFTWTTGSDYPWQFSPVASDFSPDTAGVCTDVPGTTWLETTVTGPGVVNFAWRGTEAITSHRSTTQFLVDGVLATHHSHDLPWDARWERREIAIPAGTHVLRWQTLVFRPDLDTCTELDAFTFRQASLMHTAAEAHGLAFSTATAGLEWKLETADTADGADALRFPSVVPSFDRQLLSTRLNGPGRLRFSWKAAAEHPLGGMTFLSAEYNDPIDPIEALSNVWRDEDVVVPSGSWPVGWGGNALADGLLDRISWTPDVPTTLAEALDGTEIAWSTDPASPWLAWASPGTADDYAVPAPELRTQQGSPVVLTGVVTGPGTLKFTWQSGSPFSFYSINFFSAGNSFSSRDWPGTVTVPLAQGVQTLRWQFSEFAPRGALLDHVSFVPWTPVSAGEATETGARTWITNPDAPWQGYQLPGAVGDDALLAAPVDGSWVQTKVTGPGLLDFSLTRLPASTERWIVTVNDVAVSLPQPEWPGIFFSNAEIHTIRWTYRTTAPSARPFGLDDVSWTPAESPDLSAAVDSQLSLTTSHPNPWIGTSVWAHDGVDAACSVALGTWQGASMGTTITGPATVSFYWRLAYHQPAVTPSLTLSIDGRPAIRAPLSIDINRHDWQLVHVSLGEGEHTLSWEHAGADTISTPQAPVGPNPNSGAWVDGLSVSDDAGVAGALEYNGSGVVATGDVSILNGEFARDGVDAVAVTPSGKFTVPLREPGLLGFWWKANEDFGRLVVAMAGYSTSFFSEDGEWQFNVLPYVDGQNADGSAASFTAESSPGGSVHVDGLTFFPRGPLVSLNEALDFFPAGPWFYTNGYWSGSGARSFDGVDAAWSAVTPHTGTATLSTTLDGTGTLTFRAAREGSSALWLKIHNELLPGFSNDDDWTLHSVRLGAGSHPVYFVHEPLPDSVFGEAFVDEFAWIPGPDLTPAMATDAPALAWPDPALTWWRPLGYDGMKAVGDHAMVMTTGTRPSGESRNERLTLPVSGPGVLRWRWRWTNHPLADQSGGRRPRSVEMIQEDGRVIFGGGQGLSPALFCSVDGSRLRGLARWGSTIETSRWYEAALYVPAGAHSVAWEMARDSSVSGAVIPGVSGLLDAVTLQPVSASYGDWIAGHVSGPPGQGPEEDPDGDGVPNLIEWAGGSHPANGASIPDIRLTVLNGHPRLTMPLAGIAGVALYGEQSADLLTWSRSSLTDLSQSTPGWFTVEGAAVGSAGSQRYFRVAAELIP
jgi:hypothetical protein